jgi:copper chaperone CopZ
VKRSLVGVEGVIEAEVSYKKAKAWVKVLDNVTDEMLEEAVRSTGRFKGKVVIRESGDAGENGNR